jgi:hypothetical protein
MMTVLKQQVEAKSNLLIMDWLRSNDNGGNLLPLFANYNPERKVMGELLPIKTTPMAGRTSADKAREELKQLLVVRLQEVAVFTHSLKLNDKGMLMADIEVLDTPSGKMVQEYIERGIGFCLAIRAIMPNADNPHLIAIDVSDTTTTDLSGVLLQRFYN